MTPVAGSRAPDRVITCDESGYEGEKLVGGTTDVFVHGSVSMDQAEADACMVELRARIKSPATEYKANHLLREKHRRVLVWLLGESAPLLGHARIHLIDKTYFLIARAFALLTDAGEQPALALYAQGPRLFGWARWAAFLESANNVLRVKERVEAVSPIDAFFHMLAVLEAPEGPVTDAIRLLQHSRPQAEAFRAALATDAVPSLDALIPAIARAVAHWGADGTNVTVIHDRQNALSPERVVQLKEMCPGLADLRLAASADDARIQLADIVAGTARRIASELLNGRGDDELAELFTPYSDPASIWVDPRSWGLLGPR